MSKADENHTLENYVNLVNEKNNNNNKKSNHKLLTHLGKKKPLF